jgi:hypothetical protein
MRWCVERRTQKKRAALKAPPQESWLERDTVNKTDKLMFGCCVDSPTGLLPIKRLGFCNLLSVSARRLTMAQGLVLIVTLWFRHA